MEKRKSRTKILAAFMMSFVLLLSSFNVPIVRAEDPEPISVTINLNGGSLGGQTGTFTEDFSEGDIVAAILDEPTRDGYTFNGWTGGNASVPLTGPMTITAQWNPDVQPPPPMVTVTFQPGFTGGWSAFTVPTEQGTTLGSQFPVTPQRNGYTFAHWQITSGGSGTFTSSVEVNNNITVTAQWTANQPTTATITFNPNGGNLTGPTTRTVNVGQSINEAPANVTMPTNPTRAGFTFNGWQMPNGNAFNANIRIYTNTVVTAQWTQNNQATITFDLNGGQIGNSSTNPSRTVNIGQNIANTSGVSMPNNPTRSGFTFNGWEMSNGNTFDANTNVNNNIIVTARWTSGNQSVVTFELDGGHINNNNSNVTRAVTTGQSINNTSGVSMPNNPTRSGFTFAGWEMANGSTFSGVTIVESNMTVIANWASSSQSIITFNLDGGNINQNTANQTRVLSNGRTISNTSGVSMPANPTRQGFTFGGWELANGNEFSATTVVNSNVTVTAIWTSGNQATVTFNLAGGNIGGNSTNPTRTVTRNQSINNTTNVSMPNNPTRQGYTFTGWQMANGNAFTATTTVASNITVTAQWTSGNQATVTFNLNGGAIGATTANQTRDIPIGQSINSTSGVSMPTNPTMQGFAFSGWRTATMQEFNGDTIVNSSITVTAHWTFSTNNAPLVNQIITLNENGVVSVGGNIVTIAEDLGRFHINADGVSVLPARAVLSVLFGANPHDPHLFVWYPDTNTFSIDPQGRNIRIQVGNQTMFVGGAPRVILSGQGDTAFPYAAYIDPADSRMYVPVRAIAESVGFSVEWNEQTRTVFLIPPGIS